MKCTQTEKLLAKRALGILPLRVAHKLEEHVQQCPACQAVAKYYESACAVLQSPGTGSPPPYLADRIIYLAREQKECAAKAHSRIRWLPALAGAAAIGLALLLTPHIFSPYRPMSSQEALDAYAEDFKALGVWEEEENGAGDSFKYENYGIPESVSRYMI